MATERSDLAPLDALSRALSSSTSAEVWLATSSSRSFTSCAMSSNLPPWPLGGFDVAIEHGLVELQGFDLLGHQREDVLGGRRPLLGNGRFGHRRERPVVTADRRGLLLRRRRRPAPASSAAGWIG